MIVLLLLQLSLAIEAYHHTDYQRAYNLAREINLDTLDNFERYEVLEVQAYTATSVREFDEADSLFQIVFKTKHESILRKAYTNYAYLQYQQMNFDKRLQYLQEAYNIKPTNQLTRIIARHHFQINADYELAETWLSRHTIPTTAKDSSGYYATLAELAEAKRQYDQAIDYWHTAKISAQQANLFNYELFASKGLHRSDKIIEAQKQENMINIISWLILSLIGYFIFKHKEHVSTILGKDSGGR